MAEREATAVLRQKELDWVSEWMSEWVSEWMKKDGVCGKRKKWKKEVEVGSGQQHKLKMQPWRAIMNLWLRS
jgi:hypothetical protein